MKSDKGRSLSLKTEFWDMVVGVHGRIAQQINPKTRERLLSLLSNSGVEEPRHFFHFVYVVENFDPNALSVEAYGKRDPFDDASVVERHFERWLEAGLVHGVGNGRYRITQNGHHLREKRWRLLEDELNQHPINKSEQLVTILSQFSAVKQAIETTEQPSKHNFRTRSKMGLRAPQPICPLLQFIEYRMDFGAYRDDCHLAAWEDVAPQLSPLSWEVVSILKEVGGQSINDLSDTLSRRGHHDEMMETAVQTLQAEKWAAQSKQQLTLTPAGINSRETVEELTNIHFFNPWHSALSDKEIQTLGDWQKVFQI